MTESNDIANELAEAVAQASAQRAPVYIVGGDSKRNIAGRRCDAQPMQVGQHCGIVDYTPEELVITVRAGTPVAEIQATLATRGQTLACEPPAYGGSGTLGGALAVNLSGPARPWAGALRDAVLGLRLIDGRGRLLQFGGRVMKNVAGYDVSRLQAGAMGTLGLITEVSLKVQPLPRHSVTRCFAMNAAQAIDTMNQRATLPSPLNGAHWCEGRLYLRLAGAQSVVEQYAQDWGGDTVSEAEAPWQALRELTQQATTDEHALWRLSLGPNAKLGDIDEHCVIDWGGALRWLQGDQHATQVLEAAAEHGGHASLFRGGDRTGEVRSPLTATQKAIHLRLKQVFDPNGIFNPGRLYSWM